MVLASGHVGEIDGYWVVVQVGGTEALPILSAVFCSLDGLPVLTASPAGRLCRTPMTVNGFYFPFGTLNMTVSVFFVLLGTLCMTVNLLNMTGHLFYVPLRTLHMTVNFLNMTVNEYFLGHLLRPMVFFKVRLPSSPVPPRAPSWHVASAGTGQD
jgi:hypothetical protein